jgi:hypothetical protein
MSVRREYDGPTAPPRQMRGASRSRRSSSIRTSFPACTGQRATCSDRRCLLIALNYKHNSRDPPAPEAGDHAQAQPWPARPHRVLALGHAFHLEKLTDHAWQRTYGTSILLCAPGMLVER